MFATSSNYGSNQRLLTFYKNWIAQFEITPSLSDKIQLIKQMLVYINELPMESFNIVHKAMLDYLIQHSQALNQAAIDQFNQVKTVLNQESQETLDSLELTIVGDKSHARNFEAYFTPLGFILNQEKHLACVKEALVTQLNELLVDIENTLKKFTEKDANKDLNAATEAAAKSKRFPQ